MIAGEETIAELRRLQQSAAHLEGAAQAEFVGRTKAEEQVEMLLGLLAERDRLRAAIEHGLRYGKVGKQSERRLRAALKGAPDA